MKNSSISGAWLAARLQVQMLQPAYFGDVEAQSNRSMSLVHETFALIQC